ncbi:Re/Si-specific NAD(P)(+) transhydrogenase subunit alpha [bacterium]|nr:Re/Si-specific NAD(P)(+) transhydrogenase subunit alpha [bacterium]
MKLAVLRERKAGEKRVAATPETIKKYIALGCSVTVEAGAGEGSSISDEAFKATGASIGSAKGADIILAVQKPDASQVSAGALLIALLSPLENPGIAAEYAKLGVNAYAMEMIPRISRAQAMDALSSQSNLAGYKAVVDAASMQGRALPMMMTAAGTVAPCKLLVLGAGVAGLQAIATGRRLGAVVSAFDVRPAVKEQVQSLGASFVDVPADPNESAETSGGYAKEMSAGYQKRQKDALLQAVQGVDIIVTTALIPGKPAPKLISKEMVAAMAPGGIIMDLAAPAGGNCEVTQPGKVITHGTVTVVGELNMASRVAVDASRLYAKNIQNLLQLILKKEEKGTVLNLNLEDQIIKDALLTLDGKVLQERFAHAKMEAPKAVDKSVTAAKKAAPAKKAPAVKAKPVKAKAAVKVAAKSTKKKGR